ncbi:MAG: ester cyclase [Pseudomonadota bacterium]|nr:ester cyclase [Pseudomonadota bacterium]
MNMPVNATLPGFDAEFADLDDYIRSITARIWEGRQTHRIADWYGADCAVITPGGTSSGVNAVVRGTLETLQQFPDRRLLCEDIVSAGSAATGWLSSHRISSTMTHRGDGAFGRATGRRVRVRTVADCICRDNRIVHEWLVRDQGAIALQIGSTPHDLAATWLAARGAPTLPLWQPPAPAAWVDPMHDSAGAALLARTYRALWGGELSVLQTSLDEACDLQLPNGASALGVAEAEAFWFGLTAAFHGATLHIDSLAECNEAGRTPRVAMRWRLIGLHNGAGRYGAATGKPVEILGITHAEIFNGRILREWLLLDEVALWMQLLAP